MEKELNKLGWVQYSRDEFREAVRNAPTPECIEHYDGKEWHFYVKEEEVKK